MEAVRERWTDERMDDLNGKVDELGRRVDNGFNRLDADIKDLRGEVHGLRGEMHGEFKSLRGEMHGELRSLRGEMFAGFERMDERFERLYRTIVFASIGVVGAVAAITASPL